MNLTTQQQAFVERLCSSTSGIALRAVAGSGKTTTLKAGAQALAEAQPTTTALAVAFNKRNAEDLAAKLPSTVQCMTMNSMGHRVWMRAIKGKISLDANKTWNIAREIIPREVSNNFPDLARYVSTLKMARIVPAGCPNGPQNDSTQHYLDILEDNGYDCDVEHGTAVAAAREILKVSIAQAWAGNIDFDDQLYMPVVNGQPFPRFDVVMVDEAQDLNTIQHEMLARSVKQGGRVIAVGDPNQAIYGFRGADTRSMATLRDRFELEEMGLTYCFRCPQAVIREAQAHVPDISWPEGAPEGRVEHGADLSGVTRGSMILSRYNRHLIPTAFGLIRKGIPATILGNEIGKSLARLVRKTGGLGSIQAVLNAVEARCKSEALHYMNKNKGNLAAQWMDKSEIIHLIAEWSGSKDGATLCDAIERLFSNYSSPVTLGTVHKAKGMEWQKVFFLAPELVPSKWALRKGGAELEQENNIKYVGITRSQNELFFVPEAHTGIGPQAEEFKAPKPVAELTLQELMEPPT